MKCSVRTCNNTDKTHELILSTSGDTPICVKCLEPTENTTTWEIEL